MCKCNAIVCGLKDFDYIIKKWHDLQLALCLGFWVAMTICNLAYFTSANVIEQVALVTTNATHHMWNCIHMQLVQFNYNYVKTTTMQF